MTLLLIISSNVNAQLRQYVFANNLHENGHVIHDLVPRCAGSYATEYMPAYNVTHNVYEFTWGCGLEWFDTANFIGNGTYTIEMYIKLDTLTSWRKIVDFKDRYQGVGLYQKDGRLYPYPGNVSTDTVLHGFQWAYIAFSRDSATSLMYFVVNGAVVSRDTDGVENFRHDGTMYFFGDDSSHSPAGTYQTGGSVAFINIYNHVIDTSILKTHNTDLAVTLGVQNVNAGTKITASLSPNPAINYLRIGIEANEYQYSLLDVTGRVLKSGDLHNGSNTLDVSELTGGMYILKLSDGISSSVYKFMKQ